MKTKTGISKYYFAFGRYNVLKNYTSSLENKIKTV